MMNKLQKKKNSTIHTKNTGNVRLFSVTNNFINFRRCYLDLFLFNFFWLPSNKI